MPSPVTALVLVVKGQMPSSRLRLLECFGDFRENGIEPTAMPVPSGILGRWKMLRSARNYDVVVLQKKITLRSLELALLKRMNPRVVFDMDDAVMFDELVGRGDHKLTGENVTKFVRTINHCAGAVVGNRFLACFVEPNLPRVIVLPTPVDTRKYLLKDYAVPTDGSVTVGWIGLQSNLRYLSALTPVFQRLAARFPKFSLKVVSNGSIDIPGVNVINERWTLNTEIASLCSFDIGVMPLDDSLWSRGKGGYKILQYMGVGVPTVASPTGINAELVMQDVNGLLVRTEEEWETALATLIGDANTRRRMGLQGRADVEARYSRRQYAKAYADFLKSI